MDAASAGGNCRDCQYSSLSADTKANKNPSDFLPFPEGTFKNIAEVKKSQPEGFLAIKKQYLCDIDRLKSLSNRLVGKVLDENIDEFYSKINGELSFLDSEPASLLSFRETRYHLHFLVSYIESFLSQEFAALPASRDYLCAMLDECLSGINYCVQGSSSRLRSAFIRLKGTEDIKCRIKQISHDALDYAIKLFLAKERISGFISYRLGNEVHWYNALYNLVCDHFGLEPIVDSAATLGSDLRIIGRFERALVVYMVDREVVNSLVDELYQKLISVLEKNNKRDWLTHRISGSELSFEIISEIEDEFFFPINMHLNSHEENKLNLSVMVESDDAGYFYFPSSYERLQVWLINALFLPSVTVVTNISGGIIPHRLIGSIDHLYFWVFESANDLKEGASCHFDWGNHQTLSLAHLENVRFSAYKKELCFNLLAHSIQYSNKLSDFFSFFLNNSALAHWKEVNKINPKLLDILKEKLTNIMRGDGIIHEFDDVLNKYPAASIEDEGWYFIDMLFRLALDIRQYNIAGRLFRLETCKCLSTYTEFHCHGLVCALIESNDYSDFKLLVNHARNFNVNSTDENGDTALMLAARQGKIKFLERLLVRTGINVNQENSQGYNALMEAAENNHLECLCALLDLPSIHVNSRNRSGSTALLIAASMGNLNCLAMLLTHRKIKIDQRNSSGWTALTLAIAKGRNGCLKALLAHKRVKLDKYLDARIPTMPGGGTTHLMIAAKYGQADCLQLLLDYDARHINLQNRKGNTALMVAAPGGDERCATALLEHPDIDIEKVDFSGKTLIELVARDNLQQRPWQYYRQCLEAANNGNSVLLKESLGFARSLIHARDEQGKTPLMLAARNDHLDCLHLLLEIPGINPDLQDKEGFTALMLAANYNCQDCLEMMMAYGKIRIRNGTGQSALMLAAGNNSTQCLALLLTDKNVGINDRDNDGLTALMYAASFGHTDCLKALLIHREIKVNQRNSNGCTALMLAAENGFTHCLSALLAHKSINTGLLDHGGRSSLMVAAKNSHATCLQLLLEHNSKLINLQSKNGMTALMEAALGESERCATRLLEHPDINIKKVNSQRKTAFDLVSGVMLRRHPWQSFQQCFEAADVGNYELLAEQITFCRALIHARDKRGQTPLMLAAKSGHSDCLEFLLQQKGINPDVRSNKGYTALILSAGLGRTQCLGRLLASGNIDVNAQSEEGWTALILAAHNRQVACIKLLLAHRKVKVNLITSIGSTALMIAAEKGHTDCLEALLTKKMIKPGLTNRDKLTALMLSARHGHEGCVRALLEHDGRHINIQGNCGNTALMLATVGGHENCVSLLLQQPNIKIGLKNVDGMTALDMAIRQNHGGCQGLLVARGGRELKA